MEFSCKLFILVLVLPTIAICAADSIFQECGKNFSITSNSLLQDNINYAFFGLLTKTAIYGFSTASYGVGMDTIYGLTRCRGDINRETCSACILDAAEKIRTICPFSAQAKIMCEQCLLCYDSSNFLGQSDTSYIQSFHTTSLAADTAAFDQTVSRLMDAVKASAATGDDKFGRGEIKDLKNNVTVYGMAQCTRDLQEAVCNQCLGKLSVTMVGNCKYRLGCYVLSASCVLRYEINKFLIDVAAPSSIAFAPSPQ